MSILFDRWGNEAPSYNSDLRISEKQNSELLQKVHELKLALLKVEWMAVNQFGHKACPFCGAPKYFHSGKSQPSGSMQNLHNQCPVFTNQGTVK